MDHRGRLGRAITGSRVKEGVGHEDVTVQQIRVDGPVLTVLKLGRLWLGRLIAVEQALPRFAGSGASVLLLGASIGCGLFKGGHLEGFQESVKAACEAAANAAGFRILMVSVEGNSHVSRPELLAAAGVTQQSSLLLLDVDRARAGLKAIPWVADASVRKLYPDRLLIAVAERQPFALWQSGGRVSVIAADGTVLGPLEHPAFAGLPLVVGAGAAATARDLLPLLDRYPQLREQVRAAIRVAERRWNLRLKNGLDVKLPETNLEQALQLLATLDADKRLLSRDILSVDLRLPDRVSVRLPADAAQVRSEMQREKAVKRKGGDA